ncbi:hypothetical protein [Acetobacterium wieringae]|uniref:Uncharacterized protein n=1 Tax=Acetobacterium wieringae TaxID=52694 RepID=A0A5D0WMU3_9FIRM|nr:hypothetical protein [Acetobacterium wieringae]MEA4805228.1 hypothetical protein [Acetobacterium wieringae]TYC85560.1 hypothetical protein FXB42_09310 [Acetobacterium wieringae]
MSNKDIRSALKESQIRHWQMADFLGIHENTFVRHLRKELPEEEKQKIYSAIEELKQQKEAV